jgi:glycosyltransferase involved in cell wall biosynthesis
MRPGTGGGGRLRSARHHGRTTGGAEVVTEASGILLADPNDADALAGAMRALTDDPERRRAMSQAAAASAPQYTWDRIAASYVTLYRRFAH